MENKLLTLLENDATLTPEQLSVMLDKEVGDIKKMILDYEKEGVILGYKTLVDWDKTSREYVTAIIEVKTTPQPERGFDRIEEKTSFSCSNRSFMHIITYLPEFLRSFFFGHTVDNQNQKTLQLFLLYNDF